MDSFSETSSVTADTRSMSGSRVSKGGSALARAFLFQARTTNSAYDPPPLTRDLIEIVTFGCGQLEQLPKSDDGIDDGIGGDPDDDIDGAEEPDDLAIMKRPVLFKGYLEL